MLFISKLSYLASNCDIAIEYMYFKNACFIRCSKDRCEEVGREPDLPNTAHPYKLCLKEDSGHKLRKLRIKACISKFTEHFIISKYSACTFVLVTNSFYEIISVQNHFKRDIH